MVQSGENGESGQTGSGRIVSWKLEPATFLTKWFVEITGLRSTDYLFKAQW
jgi:hypothetical protein